MRRSKTRESLTSFLCSLIRIRPLDPAQPLDEALQVLVGQLRATLSHVESDDTPPVGAVSRIVDPVHAVARRACRSDQRLGFIVAEKGRDLRRNVRARKWFRRRAKLAYEPIEKNIAIGIRDGNIQILVLALDQAAPSGSIERIVGIVV